MRGHAIAFVREMIFVYLMCGPKGTGNLFFFHHLSFGIVFLLKFAYPLLLVVLKRTFRSTWNFQLASICFTQGICFLVRLCYSMKKYMYELDRKAQKLEHMAITPGITSYPSCWPKCFMSHLSHAAFSSINDTWLSQSIGYYFPLIIHRKNLLWFTLRERTKWMQWSKKNYVVHCWKLYLRFRLTSCFSN